MPFKFKNNLSTWLSLYLAVYVGLTLFNLAYLPTAWDDETWFLDLGIHFLKTGRFASDIWPHPGTEIFFFAHMPMMGFVHIVNLSVFPWEIFFVRLPFVLMFFSAMYLLFRLLTTQLGMSTNWSLFVIFLFINDRATAESVRSVRAENLELLLLLSVLWRMMQAKSSPLTAFLLALLCLTHPKSWGIVLCLGTYLFLTETNRWQQLVLSVAFVTPLILFMWWGNFDVALFKTQFFSHAEEHTVTSAGSDNIWWNHFVLRYWPCYLGQPYVPLIALGAIPVAVSALWKNKLQRAYLPELAFLTTQIYWFFSLGAFTRHNPVLLVLAYLIFFRFLWRQWSAFGPPLLNTGWRRLALLALFPIICFPFLSRHAAALTQRPERDLYAFFNWCDVYFKGKEQKKILLVEDPAAHYYTLSHPGFDFSLNASLPKFRYEAYDEVYCITHARYNRQGYRLLGVYNPPLNKISEKLQHMAITYRGLAIYRITSRKAFLTLNQ